MTVKLKFDDSGLTIEIKFTHFILNLSIFEKHIDDFLL
jgi:hypothetical protein